MVDYLFWSEILRKNKWIGIYMEDENSFFVLHIQLEN